MIDIRSNIKQIERKLNALAWQQVPWASAVALNNLAALTVKAEQAEEHRVLDRPRPFTTNALRLIRATKARQYVTVRMLDSTANYLAPYLEGGKNTLNGKALLKPVGAKQDLDQYGNLPRNLMQQLKARSDIYIGKVQTKGGMVSGVWQRTTAEGGKATVQRKGKLVRTGRGLNTGNKLKLLIRFQDAHEVTQRLDWHGVAERQVSRQFNREFGKAMAKAMATARR